MEAPLRLANVPAPTDLQRIEAVARHLPTVAAMSRMVDQLCELHFDLAGDDLLQQVLHSLGFVWQQIEAELLSVAASRRN